MWQSRRSAEGTSQPSFLRTFRVEIDILKSLSHRHVTKFISIIVHGIAADSPSLITIQARRA